MRDLEYDVVIVGSGAGGGTVAQELGALARAGKRILVLEQGPRLDDPEFSGQEMEMSRALCEDGGAFLTADGSISLSFGRAYGGSTVVATGVSLVAPDRVIREWCVPGLSYGDVAERARKFMTRNEVHYLPRVLINQNNKLFVTGCLRAGHKAEHVPVNVRGCKGSSLCRLGCPNGAKMGTDRVQLPSAERDGVEVVARAEVLRLDTRAVVARVHEKPDGGRGLPSSWAPGDYTVRARIVVAAGGAIGTSALLLRSDVTRRIPGLGLGFTCHPAHVLVAEHEREITNDVGHPTSYYLDRAEEEGYLLEPCLHLPYFTARSLAGFGAAHSQVMRAFPRLQMIQVLACDRAVSSNRITVASNGRPVVAYTLTRDVIRTFVRATRLVARISFAAGALRVHAPSADPPLIERADAYRVDDLIDEKYFLPGRVSVTASHLMGGCGMGAPGQGVTDSRGRVHGIPWLRVADASLFPDSVETHPYLTIMALADRVAEGIRDDLAGMAS